MAHHKSPPGTPMTERILNFVRPAPCPLTHDRIGRPIKGPCWLWTGGRWNNGYGKIKWTQSRKNIGAHVASYMAFIGPIAPGMEIDHLCRVVSCVNPGHLDQVTPTENRVRGDGPRLKKAKTHCPKNHEYTPENSVYVKRGEGRARTCRECARLSSQKWNRIYANRKRVAAGLDPI